MTYFLVQLAGQIFVKLGIIPLKNLTLKLVLYDWAQVNQNRNAGEHFSKNNSRLNQLSNTPLGIIILGSKHKMGYIKQRTELKDITSNYFGKKLKI